MRAELDDAPGIHHRDPVADFRDDAEIVGDEQDRGALLAPQIVEQAEHLRLDRDVERGRRLVGDQDAGIVGERHGDADPLAHAAGKLVRIAVGALARVGDLDQFEELDRPLPGVGIG